MARKMPNVGRPKRTPGAAVPPKISGETNKGTMRSRSDADKPVEHLKRARSPQTIAGKPAAKRKA